MTGEEQEKLSRARAAFLGFAIGDALGAPVEFMTTGEIMARHGVLRDMVGGGWLRLKPGQVTDDTAMALCVSRGVCGAGGWNLRRIAEEFADWLKSRPVDVGDTCRRGIRNFMLKGQLETPFNQWDGGNGGLMRMVPVALQTLGDEELLRERAIAQARITHNHPFSDAACVVYGRMLHLAINGRSKNRLRREADALAAEHPQFSFTPYRGLATGYVVDTFQTVLHHFFSTTDFEECLVRTVNQGGDADTTGAIAGGLAGAYYGMEGIPRRWIRKLEGKVADETLRASETLLKLSPARIGG